MKPNVNVTVAFPYRQIWKARAPPSVAFFAWEVGKECILTIDKLMNRGGVIVNTCYLCKRVVETCNHLLLWCPVAHLLWSMVYNLLGICCVWAGLVKAET